MSIRIVVAGNEHLFSDVKDLWERHWYTRTDVSIAFPENLPYLDDVATVLATERERFVVVLVDEGAHAHRSEMGRRDISDLVEHIAALSGTCERSSLALCTYQEHIAIDDVIRLQAAKVWIAASSNLERLHQHILEHVEQAITLSDHGSQRCCDGVQTPYQDNIEAILELRFNLPTPQLAVRMIRRGEQLLDKAVPIRCDETLIDEYLQLSCRIDELAKAGPQSHSLQTLRELMAELSKLGIHILNQDDVVEEYRQLVRGDFDSIRLKIVTSEPRYPALFEALQIAANPRPLVVEHPTYRYLHLTGDPRLKLDWNPAEPINILAVMADVPAGENRVIIEGGDDVWVKFQPIYYVDKERDFFGRMATLANTGGGNGTVAVGKVTLLPRPDDQRSLYKQIEAELTSNTPYHFFHFAGHAFQHWSGTDRSAVRLVLPSNVPMTLEALTFHTLTEWLKAAGVQFVYLNCCSGVPSAGGAGAFSGLGGVANLFQTAGIPVTLGFRWDILDDRAYEFAEDYYRELLLNGRNFDEAMQCARKARFDRSAGDDFMWAAPVLLLN